MARKFPDIFPDRDDDALVVGVLGLMAVAIGLHTFIGPADSRKVRFQETLPVATVVLGVLFPGWAGKRLVDTIARSNYSKGLIDGEKHGIEIGYQIPNPALAPAREALAKAGTALEVTQAARALINEEALPEWAQRVGRGLDVAERVRDASYPFWADPVGEPPSEDRGA